MSRYVILSVNSNPDYLYFTPLTCWAWQKFGWNPIVLYHGKDDEPKRFVLRDNPYYDVPEIQGYRSDTITQVSRLYASMFVTNRDAYLMTADIDMLPLSDYWQFDENAQTVWGHDLTGYGHYPICYIGMKAHLWRTTMKIDTAWVSNAMKKDLDSLPQAKSEDFYKFWFTDQDLITQKLKPFSPVIKNRGQYSNGFAVGRVDRGAWSLNHDTFIDCHMFQQVHHKRNADKFAKTMELLTSIWPNEDFTWFTEYTKEFQRLTGNP